MRKPLIRSPIVRARIEGMMMGMFITLAIIWIAEPIVTGKWYLL